MFKRTIKNPTSKKPPKKNMIAAAIGKIGGKIGGPIGGPKGGRARAEKLSPERRSEIARKAAKARWGK